MLHGNEYTVEFVLSPVYSVNSEDRRRGYVGCDYGEDDDEVDYSKQYQDGNEDVSLLVSTSCWCQANLVTNFVFARIEDPKATGDTAALESRLY